MPPITIAPGSLADIVRSVGRARVFYSPLWSGVANLALSMLGDTKGDITVAANDQIGYLTGESTGPAKLEGRVEGSDPLVTLPMRLADPALRPILTPAGNGGAGYSGPRPLKEYTLVVIPEALFLKADGGYGSLTFTKGAGGGWKLDGVAIPPEQRRFLDKAVWFWRGHFSRAPITFKGGDAGESVDSVPFQVMQSWARPEGQMLYTVGDPADSGVDIQPVAA